MTRHIASSLLLVVFLCLSLGTSSPTRSFFGYDHHPPVPMTHRLTAEELFEAFDNSQESLRRFEYENVIVTGPIRQIRLRGAEDSSIVLGGTGREGGVRCYFVGHYAGGLQDLALGETVSVRGVVKGKRRNVLLEYCVVQDPGP